MMQLVGSTVTIVVVGGEHWGRGGPGCWGKVRGLFRGPGGDLGFATDGRLGDCSCRGGLEGRLEIVLGNWVTEVSL